jgi:phosphatidylglycerol:prolipoprotein diacylglycerol transferase
MLHLGKILIPAYGLAVAAALMLGILLAMRCARRLQLDTHAVWNMLLIVLLAALVGTRVEFMAFHLRDVMHSATFLLNGRGISWGGVLAALIASLVYTRILKSRGKRLPLLRTLDALAAPLLLSLAVMEGVAAAALWGIGYAPGIFCVVHLLACRVMVVLLERKGASLLQDGEYFGATLYVLSLSLLGWNVALQHSLMFALDLTPLLWSAAYLAILAGALWVDWTAFKRKSTSSNKEHHAL